MDPNECDFDSLMDRLLNNPPAPPKTFLVDLNTGSVYETFKVLCYIFTELVKLYNRTNDDHSDTINLDSLPEDFIQFVNEYMRSFGVEADYLRVPNRAFAPGDRLVPHRECASLNLEDYNFIISSRYVHTTRFFVI
jgi:hypothetical protein